MKNLTRFAMAALALAPMVGFGQTLAPSADTYYVPGNGTNFGTGITVTVGSSSSVGLVQFDLTQLPLGVTAAQIQKATLTLFLDHVNSGGTTNVDTVSASTPWSELTVNGNSGISPGSAVQTSVSVATTDTFISMDATAAVQGWIATPGSNNGFMILANGSTSVQFDSKENTTTSHPATLTIVLASSGPAGATGATGPTGSNGTNGAVGATGATGANGVAGATGATGATGANGVAGATGATGANGVAGPTGANGSNGSNGATGATGANGSNGSNGATGATGANGSNGSNGATGATGANGTNGTNGATGPTGSNGTNGTNGATGPTGSNGTNGSNGATGPTGSPGSNGTNGTNGTNGATGATGPTGSNGTGANPSGIPVTVSGHSGLSTFFSPTSSVGSTAAAFSASETAVAPTACKPSMTIWNYSGSTTQYTLFPVTGSTLAIGGTAIMSVTVANGSSGSITAGSDVLAGSLMTLTSGASNAGAAPGGNGFYLAFSCQ